MSREELVLGQIYKTNTLIPDGDWDSIPFGILVRLLQVGPLCDVEPLRGGRTLHIPPGNLEPATEEDIADGGPKLPPPRPLPVAKPKK